MTDAVVNPPIWHTDVPAEVKGMWENKKFDITDPKKVAIEVSNIYREAEKLIGAPPSQLLRLPADPVKDADAMTNIWRRLGAPEAADKYDLAALKDKDGKVLDTKLDGSLRTAFAKSHVPQSMAADVAAAVRAHLVDVQSEQEAAKAATIATEKKALKDNWGTNEGVNKAVAQKGARALGLDIEMLNAIEGAAGYAKTMEMLRRVGAVSEEDTFVKSPADNADKPMSVEAATAKIAELKTDKEWVKRYQGGDKRAAKELTDLLTIQTAGREIRL